MPEQQESNTDPNENEAPPEGTEGTPGAESDDEGSNPEGDPEGESEENDDEDGNDWSESARAEITKVRNEAARYRTRLREVEEKFKDAKTPEEFEAAVNEQTERNRALESELLRERIARKFDLPDDLAEVLKGDDEKSLTEHAKKLQKYAGTISGDGDVRGGLDPNDDDDEPSDPAALARTFGRGRKRRP